MYGGNIMTTRPPFHEQLRYERDKRGWSQADLAEKVGCDTKTIGRWEKGDSVPRSYHRQALCDLFGKDAEELGLVSEKPGNSQVGEASGHGGQAQGPHLSAPPPLVPTTSTMDAPSEPSSLEVGQAQGPHLSTSPPLVPTINPMDAPSELLE